MDGYIFHLPDGTPISEKRLQNEIDKTVKRINTDGIEFDRFDNNKIFILPFLSRLTAMARWAWIFLTQRFTRFGLFENVYPIHVSDCHGTYYPRGDDNEAGRAEIHKRAGRAGKECRDIQSQMARWRVSGAEHTETESRY